MGKQDSTKTRVTPVFDKLRHADPTGQAWVVPLLALPTRDGASVDRIITPPLRANTLQFGAAEAQLEPPRSLLRWMVEHPERLQWPKQADNHDPATQAKRKALLANDSAVRAEALDLLAKGQPQQTWYVLEGRSRPDVYFETDDAIVVIEGKRTELGPTRNVSWLPGRDQMLRHLDCAWELRRNRRVFGVLIVEDQDGGGVPRKWRDACDETIAADALERSLPHRTQDEREQIAASFLGATTWNRVCDALGLECFR